tara:strand:+ start:164 stop:556 length:393 start_codon:yes stop_codon:yes gene_type:complete
MEESLFKALLDYGSLGLMCGFLLWLHVQNQKRNDSLSARFQEQLEKIRTSAKEDEDRVRDRFMSVIEKYDTEKESFFQERTQLRSNLSGQLSSLEGKVEGMASQVAEISAMIKDIQSEKRIREIARGKDA